MQSNLGNLIYLKRSKIFQVWQKNLSKQFDNNTEAKIKLIRKNRKRKGDLFTLLVKILNKEARLDVDHLFLILQKVRMPFYSISDFYTEIYCLESSIVDYFTHNFKLSQTECYKGMELVRRCLRNIFSRVLQETSEFYGQILENSKIGFVQTDKDGKIVFANQAMTHITNYKTLRGRRLSDFFKKDDKKFIQQIITDGNKKPILRRFDITDASNKMMSVGVQLGPVNISEKLRGGFATITNISRAIEEQNRVFDKAPLGVIKTNSKGKITYANPSMLQMCGLDSWQGKELRDIVPDKKNYEKVLKNLNRRIRGISGEYNIEITRMNDKKKIPARISAFPETDLEGKKIFGSIAIVQNLVRERIHRHIETIRGVEELLTAVVAETGLLVPFDLLYVSEYSSDLQHVRSIFNYPQRDEPISQKRWWEMTPARIRWVNQKEVILVEDLEKFFNRKEWKELRNEPEIQKFLKEGFKSFIFYPILREKRIIASISFFSKSKNKYLKIHQKILKRLPLYAVIQMAFYYRKREELQFTLSLINQISHASNDMYKMSKVIVDQLAQQFKWNNVALYHADPDAGQFFLRSEAATSDEYRIPSKNKTQPIDVGVLGWVYNHGKGVNIKDVLASKRFKDIFKPVIKNSRSELCLPIKFGEVCWLLNIEDTHRNAFCEDEKKSIEKILKEVCSFLEHSWTHHFLAVALQSASDAIFVTDIKGIVKQVNPAAAKLLEYSKKSILGKSMTDFLKDKIAAENFLNTGTVINHEVVMVGKKRKEIPVMLSGSQVRKEFNSNIFVVKDITVQKKLEELESIEKIFIEIATQIKTPLSLLYSWLKQLKQENNVGSSYDDLLDKALRQLHKLELTYDRMAFYVLHEDWKRKNGYHPFLLKFSEVLENIKSDLPKSDIDKIYWDLDKQQRYLNGDLFQLVFCLKAILSYLLRFAPKNKQTIKFKLSEKNHNLVIDINGRYPSLTMKSFDEADNRRTLSRTLAEIALGEKTIRTIIDNHGGIYHDPKFSSRSATFRIELPLAHEV